MLTLYVGNTNVIELQGLKNSVTGTTDTAATVEVTLKDGAGVEIAGQSWPASMVHDADGTYRATLEDDLSLRKGGRYFAYVTATGSGGEVGNWVGECIASIRTRQ